MVECWNPRPVFRVNLMRAVARIDELAPQDVKYLQSCELRSIDPTEPLKSKGHIGTEIDIQDSNDPRVAFQEEELERTRFLSDPVNARN